MYVLLLQLPPTKKRKEGQVTWGFLEKERDGERAVTPLGKSGTAPQSSQHIIEDLKVKGTAGAHGMGKNLPGPGNFIVGSQEQVLNMCLGAEVGVGTSSRDPSTFPQ